MITAIRVPSTAGRDWDNSGLLAAVSSSCFCSSFVSGRPMGTPSASLNIVTYGHEGLTLPLREAEIREAHNSAEADAVEYRIARGIVRYSSSSRMRGCGPERPPPREPTT
jgi:hypothetical protein